MTTSPVHQQSQPSGSDSFGSPATRRTELASFLRSRRERIRPEEVGFAPGVRRRTPGLRREEVAQLAGVGVTWYTWLEQGRRINVSTQVLDQLSPFPAAVLTKRYDVLAYNDGYRKAILDLDRIPVEDRNLLWLAFTYPDWECAFLDEADLHAALVAGFRAGMAEHVGEPAWQELVERLLAASPEFAKLWSRDDVAGPGSVVKLIHSTGVGVLRVQPSNLWHGNVRLCVYTPADDETERRLHQLTAT